MESCGCQKADAKAGCCGEEHRCTLTGSPSGRWYSPREAPAACNAGNERDQRKGREKSEVTEADLTHLSRWQITGSQEIRKELAVPSSTLDSPDLIDR